MTDLVPPRATDPDTGSEDGPAPDSVLALAANAPPGGDGGSSGVGTLTDDPGGDGGSEQGPTPDDPSGVLAEGNPGGDGSAEEHPNEDPPPIGAIHEIAMG